MHRFTRSYRLIFFNIKLYAKKTFQTWTDLLARRREGGRKTLEEKHIFQQMLSEQKA